MFGDAIDVALALLLSRKVHASGRVCEDDGWMGGKVMIILFFLRASTVLSGYLAPEGFVYHFFSPA